MLTENKSASRLIPALPAGEFINKPEEIDRFLIRVEPDGTIYLKSNRNRLEEFMRLCAEAGIDLNVDYISLCG